MKRKRASMAVVSVVSMCYRYNPIAYEMHFQGRKKLIQDSDTSSLLDRGG